MLTRFWRNWRSKRRLLPLLLGYPQGRFYSSELVFPELSKKNGASRADVLPYDGLADIWNDYARPYSANYAAYLRDLASQRGLELKSVLDLACGSGFHSARLAMLGLEVVGLDVNEAMLDQARVYCEPLQNVQFVRGDFREFQLGRQFDAVICPFNSLNYVGNVEELTAVFRCVAGHLRPGGVFLFDTITESGMRQIANSYLHVETRGKRFVLYFGYDPRRREERAVAIVPSGIEKHTRIPLDPSDVRKAARDSGLDVEDYFSASLFPGWLFTGFSCYFVLKRR